MDVLKNFLFPKIDFKRDIICAKIWLLYGKRLLANNTTGHARFSEREADGVRFSREAREPSYTPFSPSVDC